MSRKKNVLAVLLAHARRLFDARLVGSVYGTDASGEHFLPPNQWDRGVMDRFAGQGIEGLILKYTGAFIMKCLGHSPVHLFELNELGEQVPAEGITAYALRHHQDFYDKGVKILLAEQIRNEGTDSGLSHDIDAFSISSYDGKQFAALRDVRVNTRIVDRFRAKNFIAAYIPDYGAIVFNTVRASDLAQPAGPFIYDAPLKSMLDHLIAAIASASLAYLGQAKGHAAARLIKRKEIRLRQTAARLAQKEVLIREREAHLLSVGAVSSDQLAMDATAIHDGVFAFMDMAGSVKVSRKLTPREYFFVLNLCHESVAENAQKFRCRIDNIIGDAVFLETLSIFDTADRSLPGPGARLMRMTCLLAAVLGDIHDLSIGRYSRDREKRAAGLLRAQGLTLGFRAGMSLGPAMVGPLGSLKRRIVTAIGDAVDRASRLESCGRINHIHVTARTAGILKDAWVSKDTPLIYEFAKEVLKDRPGWAGRTGFSFFDFYRTWRGLGEDFLRTQEDPVCYKEFSADDTCLIPCIPDNRIPNTCPGI